MNVGEERKELEKSLPLVHSIKPHALLTWTWRLHGWIVAGVSKTRSLSTHGMFENLFSCLFDSSAEIYSSERARQTVSGEEKEKSQQKKRQRKEIDGIVNYHQQWKSPACDCRIRKGHQWRESKAFLVSVWCRDGWSRRAISFYSPLVSRSKESRIALLPDFYGDGNASGLFLLCFFSKDIIRLAVVTLCRVGRF